MNKNVINQLKLEFSSLRWYDKPIPNVPLQGWFLIETSPVPPADQRSMVIADICNEKIINVTDGKLYHYQHCDAENHHIDLRLSKALKTLEDVTFRVAVYPGKANLLNGQPVAIALDPIITYTTYPNHPHLNQFDITYCDFFIPDSICYIDDPVKLGINQYNRLKNAFEEICIWLFRHQIWLETCKQFKPGMWIGPASPPFERKHHAYNLNPFGCCWCGQDKSYVSCHMVQDMMERNNCSEQQAKSIISGLISTQHWHYKKGIPQYIALQNLRKAFNIT